LLFIASSLTLIVYFITMMQQFVIESKNWDKILEQLIGCSIVYASVEDEFGQDYELLTKELIPCLVYNKPKPVTPLKNFFLPVKENVTHFPEKEVQRVIIGVPNCDLEGLKILDEIYLDPEFQDSFYKHKRENTILIGSDCFSIAEHCHCTTYGIKPYTEGNGDLSLTLLEGRVTLTAFTEKGVSFLTDMNKMSECKEAPSNPDDIISEKRSKTVQLLAEANKGLPDYHQTGYLIKKSHDDIWKKYASQCVSCGACATICPTCSCFLLIDKRGFEKVKQLDACQYPGFERVAGGEDALHVRHVRFKNRYMCKYVWKPEKFKSIACTGCGRCIEACIGQISKNELFMELAN
jgi:sulfhydrogenase subunit beta (sulfur reductase)